MWAPGSQPPSGPVTPVPIPAVAPFTATQSATLGAAATPLPLASGGGYSGSVTLTGAIAPTATLTETTSNVAPVGAPTLQALARAALAVRTTQTTLPLSSVVFVSLTSNTGFSVTPPPGFTLNVPANNILPNAAYYLAEYDPSRPSLGWQEGYAGPGTISGSSIAFTPTSSGAFVFGANVTYTFALYAISNQAIAPTAAPSIAPIASAAPSPTATPVATPTPTPVATATATPVATPTPTPVPTPTPTPVPTPTPTPAPVVATPTSLTFASSASAAQTFSVTQPGYTGSFTALSSATNVATVTPSSTGTFTVTPTGAGPATITVTGNGARTTTVSVSVQGVPITVSSINRAAH